MVVSNEVWSAAHVSDAPKKGQGRRWVAIAVVCTVVAGVVALSPVLERTSWGAGSSHGSARVPSDKIVTKATVAVLPPTALASVAAVRTPSTKTAPIPTGAALPLGFGKELALSAIPWSQVGAGWTLAVWSAQVSRNPTSSTLYLVDPIGGRYKIADLGALDYVRSWSPDGRHVLMGSNNGTTSTTSLFNLVTGSSTTRGIPRDVAGFSPDGDFLVAEGAGTTQKTEKYTLTGQYELTYPTEINGVGALSGDAPFAVPGSQQLIFAGAKGFALTDADGSPIRTFTFPVDAPSGCRTAGWSVPGVLLADCTAGADANMHEELWRIPISGAAPSELHLVRGSSITQLGFFGYSDAWTYSGGMLGLSENSCGPATIVQFDARGHASRLEIPVPAGVTPGTIRLVAHGGDTVTVMNQSGTCNSSRNWLVNYNLATGKSVVLLGPGNDGGTVSEALPY